MTEYLELDDFLVVKEETIPGSTVLDYGLLESALARPQSSVFGQDAYPSIFEKAAALLHSLARNHALSDGNKRCSWVATKVFLEINGVHLVNVDVDAAEALVLAVATGKFDEISVIAGELARLS